MLEHFRPPSVSSTKFYHFHEIWKIVMVRRYGYFMFSTSSRVSPGLKSVYNREHFPIQNFWIKYRWRHFCVWKCWLMNLSIDEHLEITAPIWKCEVLVSLIAGISWLKYLNTCAFLAVNKIVIFRHATSSTCPKTKSLPLPLGQSVIGATICA